MGWFWFLGALFPMIGIIQIGAQKSADRYLYLPMVGILSMTCWGIDALILKRKILKRFIVANAILLLGIFSLWTLRNTQHWKNSVTLFEHQIQITGGDAVGHLNLGHAYLQEGQLNRAEDQLKKALSYQPYAVKIHALLGDVASEKRLFKEAIHHYEHSLALQKQHPSPSDRKDTALTRSKLDAAYLLK